MKQQNVTKVVQFKMATNNKKKQGSKFEKQAENEV